MALIDHAEIMLSHMFAQFENKPLFEGVMRVLGNRLNTLHHVFDDLQNKRWIDTSEGVQLDGCGVIVDQPRLISKAIALPFFGFQDQPSARGFGIARFRRKNESHLSSAKLADPEYQKMIKAKIAKNVSDGTTEEVIQSYQNIFAAPKVIITELENAKIRVGIARELTEAEIAFAHAANLFVKPGGIGIQLKAHFNPENTFGFRDQGLKGFGVGRFTKTF